MPICVENVSSYAEFHVSEMTEWEFLSEVVERADCGILLDVNNIYVSSQNHSFDPYALPRRRSARIASAQIHIAGHTKFEKYILDTHDHPVLDPVWKLYAHAVESRRSHRHLARMGRQHSVASMKSIMKRSRPTSSSKSSKTPLLDVRSRAELKALQSLMATAVSAR